MSEFKYSNMLLDIKGYIERLELALLEVHDLIEAGRTKEALAVIDKVIDDKGKDS
jgi:hypothetical protein